MARLFNIEVFNQTISGDATTAPAYYTSEEHAALLGSADKLVAQVVLVSQKNTSTTINVIYQHNNTLESELWGDSNASKNVIGPANHTDLPAVQWFAVDSTVDRGAFGRFKVTADNPGAVVRVIVTGYSL